MELRGQIRGKYNKMVKCVSSEVGLNLDPSSATFSVWPSENYLPHQRVGFIICKVGVEVKIKQNNACKNS